MPMDNNGIVPFYRANDPEGAQHVRDSMLWRLYEEHIRGRQRRQCALWVFGGIQVVLVAIVGPVMSAQINRLAPGTAQAPKPVVVVVNAGTAERATESPPPTPNSSQPHVYVVQQRDRLLRLAPEVPLEAKLACNPGIKDPDHIEVGQRVRIPGSESGLWVCPGPGRVAARTR